MGLLLLPALNGCPPREPAPPREPPPTRTQASLDEALNTPVALVGDQPILLRELHDVLVRKQGLNLLLHIAQARAARQQAEDASMTLSEADIVQERAQTVEGMFKEALIVEHDRLQDLELAGKAREAEELRAQLRQQREQLLDQYLQRRRISTEEFELAMQTNAALRKLAAPLVQGRITEDSLREAFALLYGETLKVRHIQLNNLQEVGEAQKRLQAGEPFEQVAAAISRNPVTARVGGEMPAFSRSEPGLPDAFKDAAFATAVGAVSNPVQAWGAYHLIRVQERIAPRAVKFDDVRSSVEQHLRERLMTATMNELRVRLAQQVVGSLTVVDPTLRAQLQELRGNAPTPPPADPRQMIVPLTRPATTAPAASAPAASAPAAADAATAPDAATTPNAATAPAAD